PAGFAAWTWFPGSEEDDQASEVEVEAGEATDLGIVTIDCEAMVLLAVQPASTFDCTLAEPGLHATRLAEGRRMPARDPRVRRKRRRPGAIELQAPPEGMVHLEGQVRHPYFAPSGSIAIDVEVELRRGGRVVLRPKVPTAGGALRVGLEPDAGWVALARID